MGYGGVEKLRDGTERHIYVPQSKDKAVFEVIVVEVVEPDVYFFGTCTVKNVSTGKIFTADTHRVKTFEDVNVIYEYIGKENDLLFIRKELLQDGTERLVYTPGDENHCVFEVVRVRVLKDDKELNMTKIEIEDTHQIDYVSADSIKTYRFKPVIYKYLGSEEEILQSAALEKTSGQYVDDDYGNDEGSGEWRYNPDTDSEEFYPDWLGGVETEEEFWAHE